MNKLDLQNLHKKIELSNKIDMEKIKVNIERSMKDVQQKFAEIDMKKMKSEMRLMEEKFNNDEFRSNFNEKMKRSVEEGMEKAKVGMEKAKTGMKKAQIELENLKKFTDELEKDGLIDKKKGYKVELKDGDLFINGEKQKKETTEKYKKYYMGDKFMISMNGDKIISL
jgi:hypothetical protein